MRDETQVELGSFSGFLMVLRRRLFVIVLCAIIVPAVAVVYSKSRTKEYKANASVLLQNPGFAESVTGNGQSPTASSNNQPDIVTEQQVAGLPAVAARTATALGGTLSAGTIGSEVSVGSNGQANVLTFTGTDRDPVTAARMTNAYAKSYIDFRRQRDVAQLNGAHKTIASQVRAIQALQSKLLASPLVAQHRNQLGIDAVGDSVRPTSGNLSPQLASARDRLRALRSQSADLRQRQQDLATLALLQNGDASLVQAASVPGSPSSPNVKRNAIAGLALGLLLGILLAVVLELVDRRVRHPREIEEVYDHPVLGAVPQSADLRRLDQASKVPVVVKDAFRMAYDNLRFFNVERQPRSVLVTSAAQGDGKSTVAWSLAAAAAEAGSRVLLLEADLRSGTLAQRLGHDQGLGLSDVAAGNVALSEVIVHQPINGTNGEIDSDWEVQTVDCVFAGQRVRNPHTLLGSVKMQEILAEAQRDYDFVVVDAPPAVIVSDAIPLISQVSGVLVVVRLRRSRRDAAIQLREELKHLHAPLLGVVINGIDPHDGFYGNAYTSAMHYSQSAR